MSESKQARTWQQLGQSAPPLTWSLKYWPDAIKEAKFLTSEQYWHLADQLKDIASTDEPTKSSTVEIAPIGGFWELKDKGAILRKLNVRVFFVTDTEEPRSIIVLGVHKKEDEGQLRRSVVVRIERRLRLYLESRRTEN